MRGLEAVLTPTDDVIKLKWRWRIEDIRRNSGMEINACEKKRRNFFLFQMLRGSIFMGKWRMKGVKTQSLLYSTGFDVYYTRDDRSIPRRPYKKCLTWYWPWTRKSFYHIAGFNSTFHLLITHLFWDPFPIENLSSPTFIYRTHLHQIKKKLSCVRKSLHDI